MIQKSNTGANADTHLIILTNNAQRFNEKAFSGDELRYVKQELKDDKKTVTVNQYNRMVFVCVAGNKKSGLSAERRIQKSRSSDGRCAE